MRLTLGPSPTESSAETSETLRGCAIPNKAVDLTDAQGLG